MHKKKNAGWKAAELSGSGSYYNLLRSVYNFANSGSNQDTGVQVAPLSLVRAGYYYYGDGSLYSRGNGGLYWESVVYSSVFAEILHFYSTALDPQYSNPKGGGFSLRCLVR